MINLKTKLNMKNKTSITHKLGISFYALLCTVILCGCYNKGDYQYIIYMKDGSKVKAWSVSSGGGGLSVLPPHETGGWYYLSSNEYTRADYVGLQEEKK
jgi:hypothetical protein